MPKPADIVVLGDINLDWAVRGHLPFRFPDLKENGVLTWAPIEEVPGGSGLLVASVARDAGCEVLLLGAVGQDLAGRLLREWLERRGIPSAIRIDPALPTGRAFIARDAADVRLLVNQDGNANAALDAAHVDGEAGRIAGCRVLYISGYCVKDRQAPRFTATLHAMAAAARNREQRPLVVFDVVPHRIYEIYSWREFRGITEPVDLLISEVATVRRFLGLGSRAETIDTAMALETLERLKPLYRGAILRFGPSGCDREVIWNRATDAVVCRDTHHDAAADKRGFGDRLTIDALRDYFGVIPPRSLETAT